MNRIAWAALLFALTPLVVNSAEGTLFMSPERGAYVVGEVFDVSIRADSGGASVNAIEAELNFNPEALSVERISHEGSILKNWSTEPTYSNSAGVISFSGWTNEHFAGRDGLLLTITFKALRNASGNAHLAAGAMLAVSDGSNIITNMKSGLYTVAPRHVVGPNTIKVSGSEKVEVISTPPPPPLITRYEQTLRAGERIIVQGTTDPSSRVIVWLQKGSDESMYSVRSDADGFFTFTAPRRAEEGVYRLWAAVEDIYGSPGPQSERVAISVRSAGLTASVVEGTDLVSALFPYLALLLIAGLTVGYLIHRRNLAKRHRTSLLETRK